MLRYDEAKLHWRNSVSSRGYHRTLAEQYIRCINLFTLSDNGRADAFMRYAKEFWMHHLQESDIASHEDTTCLALSLCRPSSSLFQDRYLPDKLVNKIRGLDFEESAIALYIASGIGLEALVRRLTEEGASATVRSAEGWSTLHAACEYSDSAPVVKLLLDQGADLAGADADEDGRTPLICAAEEDSTDVASYLIKRGANVNAQNTKGWTPLMYSAWGDADLATQLLGSGALVNAKNRYGSTTLHLAASGDFLETVKVLLAHRVEIDAEDEGGNTPLIDAMRYDGGPEIISELVANSAEVNHQNYMGRAALMYAIEGENQPYVEVLLDKGADIKVASKDGLSTLQLAKGKGHDSIVKFLESRM